MTGSAGDPAGLVAAFGCGWEKMGERGTGEWRKGPGWVWVAGGWGQSWALLDEGLWEGVAGGLCRYLSPTRAVFHKELSLQTRELKACSEDGRCPPGSGTGAGGLGTASAPLTRLLSLSLS